MRVALVMVAAAILLVGCGGEGPTDSITVSAAASLTEAFTDIGAAFEAARPDADIAFNFDSSSTLAAQIVEGAPADVFSSADEANMTKLTDKNLVAGSPQIFARNQLVIVTKPGNPRGITDLAGLSSAGVISLCAEQVPCGGLAKQALDRAGVVIPESNITRGQNVKATVTAVTEGDAVAGVVYVTDARSAGSQVTTVTIPADENVIARYPIAVLASASNAKVAEEFVTFVLGEEAQAVLEEYGFLPPT